MRIRNETHWDSRSILRLVRRVAQDEMAEPGQRRHYCITVKYDRGQRTARLGCAPYGLSALQPSKRMTLYLSRTGEVDAIKLAHTIAHEFAHNKGIRHRDMTNTQRWGYVEGWRGLYAWAADFPVSAKPIAEVPALATVIERKLAHAESMKRKAHTRASRAKTILHRWEKRVRYYEKKLTAMKPEPPRSGRAE